MATKSPFFSGNFVGKKRMKNEDMDTKKGYLTAQKGDSAAKEPQKQEKHERMSTRPPGSRNGVHKYDNKCHVSYPTELYLRIRNWSQKKNKSVQDMQRAAMEFYINHLEREEIERTIFASRKEFKGI